MSGSLAIRPLRLHRVRDSRLARRVVRVARVAFAVFVAMTCWLVSSPAFAAAPLCDDRAATSVAPAPIILLPQASLIVFHDSDCVRDYLANAVDRDTPSQEISFEPSEPTLAFRSDRIVFDPPAQMIGIESAQTHGRNGVRNALERPPRRVWR